MSDVSYILAERFRKIRQQTAGTQECFAERSGMSQANVSRLENGKAWISMKKIAQAIRKAGGDPEDLVNDRYGVADKEIAEIRQLLPLVDRDVRLIVLQLLRREVEIARKATEAESGQQDGTQR